jgi:hypothetical protein
MTEEQPKEKRTRRSAQKNREKPSWDEVYNLGKNGLNIDQTCAHLNIGRQTWYAKTKKDGPWEDLKDAHYAGTAAIIKQVASKAIELALGGNDKLIQFILKSKGQWIETEKIQITGNEDGPVEISDVTQRLFDKLGK